MKGRFFIGCGFLKVRLPLAVVLMAAWCVAHSAPAADPLGPLRQMMGRPPAELDLAQAKLAIDRLIDPATDAPAILRRLDILAAAVRSGFPPNATDRQKLEALLVYLYQPGPWNDDHPFTYDLADPMGRELRNKLLSTYLTTRKGNCVSMPILVVILGQKLGLHVTLATAPEHVLVKYRDDNGEWMNVEATAGGYETDAGYVRRMGISEKAVTNRIYLRPLNQREAVGVMLSTLMEFYGKRGQAAQRVAVADLALEANPKDTVAMLHKASGYYVILQERYKGRYPAPADIPTEQRPDYYELSQGNLRLFAQAEALGWVEPTREKEDNYLQSIEREKARRGQ
jgi:regulator of sirC expression with transglutaminase-like and TPR domain